MGPLLLPDEYRFIEYISGTDGGATFLGCGIDFCDRDIAVDLFTEGAKREKKYKVLGEEDEVRLLDVRNYRCECEKKSF